MSVILYPREVICGSCGAAMILHWHNPLELSQGGTPVYQHPDYRGCEYNGQKIIPVDVFVGEQLAADHSIDPVTVRFANKRIVTLREDPVPHLEVSGE